MSGKHTVFTNARICHSGSLVSGERLVVSHETGTISSSGDSSTGSVVDLHGQILAPGFVELQTNGLRGFHFTHLEERQDYERKIDEVARYLPQTGVTAFYATIPTVHSDQFKKVGDEGIAFQQHYVHRS